MEPRICIHHSVISLGGRLRGFLENLVNRLGNIRRVVANRESVDGVGDNRRVRSSSASSVTVVSFVSVIDSIPGVFLERLAPHPSAPHLLKRYFGAKNIF